MISPLVRDAFLAPDLPLPEAQLESLAAVLKLRGLPVPDLATVRVLEIGCGSGTNLLSMADCFPGATFVGIDPSPVAIARATVAANTQGLAKIEFRQQPLAELTVEGKFDFILARRVYTRVGPAEQERVLAVRQQSLAPHGVVYLGYDALPGGEIAASLEHLVRFEARSADSPTAALQQARAALELLEHSLSAVTPAADQVEVRQLVLAEVRGMQQWGDEQLGHEALAGENSPIYVRELLQRARQHNLQILGDAAVGLDSLDRLAPPVEKLIAQISSQPLDREQFRDIFQNRRSRGTLLAHAGLRFDLTVKPQQLSGLYLEAQIVPDGPVDVATNSTDQFLVPGISQMSTSMPILKAVLLELGARWPQSIGIEELLLVAARRFAAAVPVAPPLTEADLDRVRESLLQLCRDRIVNLLSQPHAFVTKPSEQPLVSPWTRQQASRGDVVINRKHRPLRLPDIDRHLLPLLDGTRDPQQLADELLKQIQQGTLGVKEHEEAITNEERLRGLLPEIVSEALDRLAANAFLVG